MGKDLKGKELGKGISQRKTDGYYSARFKSRVTGKTVQKYFKKLQECRQWYADATFEDEHGNINIGLDLSVDGLHNIWLEQNKATWKKGTRMMYENYYKSIPRSFKNMLIVDIKPLHCQNLIINLSSKYSHGTLTLIRKMLTSMFNFAVDNDFIVKTPVIKSLKIPGETKHRDAMTIDEQKKFMESAKTSSYYNLFMFVLQTGLRVSELMGLQWKDIDFSKRELKVERQLVYYRGVGWEYTTPKSKAGYRIIPMTEECVRILKNQKEKRTIINIEYSDNVFTTEKGKPIVNSNIEKRMKEICKKINIPPYTMHSLRHTMCTRAFEAAANPRVMQEIMGHSNLKTTMEIYTHVTQKTKEKEIKKISKVLKIV